VRFQDLLSELKSNSNIISETVLTMSPLFAK
jgi:hypothetical protein